LADQVDFADFFAFEILQEFQGPGFRNRSKILDDFVVGHPDAVVGHADPFFLFVELERNFVLVGFFEPFIGQRRQMVLIDRIGRVGDEFAQEDFFVRVNRIDHQVEQAF